MNKIPYYVNTMIDSLFYRTSGDSFRISYQLIQADIKVELKRFIQEHPNYRYILSDSDSKPSFELYFACDTEEIKTQTVRIIIEEWIGFKVLLEQSTDIYREIYKYQNQ